MPLLCGVELKLKDMISNRKVQYLISRTPRVSTKEAREMALKDISNECSRIDGIYTSNYIFKQRLIIMMKLYPEEIITL